MVSVITINYNHSQMTIDCVNSILSSDFENFKIELIDNGSQVGDFQQLLETYTNNRKVNVHRIEKNCGYVGGINYGFEKAGGQNPDYYLIMNNDTIIDKLAMKVLVETAVKYDNAAIISGKVYHFDKPGILQQTGMLFHDHRYIQGYYPGKNELDEGQYDQEAFRDSLDDIFWLIPSKIVKDVGIYCNYFYLYAEQGDYAQRTRRKGYKLVYAPEAKIWHKGSITTGEGNPEALPIWYWRGKGTFIFQYRNLQKKYFFILMMKIFIRYIIKSYILKDERNKQIKAQLSGYFSGLKWMFNKKPDNGYNPYLKQT